MSVCTEYMWWLLPEFLKPADPAKDRTTRGIVTAAGAEMDLVRDLLHGVRDALLAARSEGAQLDLHGMERGGIVRVAGEGDDVFRGRVMAALGDWIEYGRAADLAAMLASSGYAATIVEPVAGDLRDCTAWSRFRVCLGPLGGPPNVSQQEIYRLVNRRRPAHTRALYRAADIAMPVALMDGSWTFDGTRRLPEWRIAG